MGVAQYNRGSRLAAREADARMPVAKARGEHQANTDEVTRLREQVATLERDLRRARRCLALMRLSHDARMAEARAAERDSASAIRILARVAFGAGDTA